VTNEDEAKIDKDVDIMEDFGTSCILLEKVQGVTLTSETELEATKLSESASQHSPSPVTSKTSLKRNNKNSKYHKR